MLGLEDGARISVHIEPSSGPDSDVDEIGGMFDEGFLELTIHGVEDIAPVVDIETRNWACELEDEKLLMYSGGGAHDKETHGARAELKRREEAKREAQRIAADRRVVPNATRHHPVVK